MTRHIDVAVFDLGGVVMAGGSPNDVADRAPHLPAEEVIGVVFGDYGRDTDHPWHRLERGEIEWADYRQATAEALTRAGIHLPDDGPALGSSAPWGPNPAMVSVVGELRAAGVATALLTNNIAVLRPIWRQVVDVGALFDVVVDSHEVGLRKPDPAIYRLTLERLGATDPSRVVFLDDIASNLEPARALGWHTLHVAGDGADAIAAVRTLAGLA